ncbi:hypothetical protein [Actinocrispum sp. NPDC049592]|uniref:hypothetical protein n=1 Tax=Actinocrispum sp. NPDC049592 TaxID=3154835 RepID=UPI00342B78C3
MSMFEALDRVGTAALLRFLVVLLLFVALHLARQPFRLADWLLMQGMRWLNAQVTTALPPRTQHTGKEGWG